LLKVLFEKRPARFKWVVALPGAVALLFLGHALEDGGLSSAAPYAAVVLMSALYLLRPMLIVWGPVFAAFVFYSVAVLVNPDNGGPRSEWIIFLLMGIVPVVVLWLARPGTVADASLTGEPMREYWEIDWEREKARVDSVQFFKALWTHFPDATTFYAEGNSIAGDVSDCYRVHHEEGDYLPLRQTIFPRSAKFRCRFSSSLTGALSALAGMHAEPELLDHLSLYRESEELIFWPDAFANVLLVSRSVPENVVAAFAADLGLTYSAGSPG
jgi:hypothetical protein